MKKGGTRTDNEHSEYIQREAILDEMRDLAADSDVMYNEILSIDNQIQNLRDQNLASNDAQIEALRSRRIALRDDFERLSEVIVNLGARLADQTEEEEVVYEEL